MVGHVAVVVETVWVVVVLNQFERKAVDLFNEKINITAREHTKRLNKKQGRKDNEILKW